MNDVSVVIPVFDNATTLAELHARLTATLGDRLRRAVYVDDGSSDASAAVLARLAAGDRRAQHVDRVRNGGQQRALVDGLAAAREPDAPPGWIVCIDADLQDPPEAIGDLLAEAERDGWDVVFAARRGRYESRGRLLTSRVFKHVLAALTGVPAGASSFVLMRSEVADAVLALDGGGAAPPFLTSMIATTHARCTAVSVDRAPSSTGSGYSSAARVRSAVSGLRWALRSRTASDHNQVQLDYYAARHSSSIRPRPTPYAQRQVDEAIAHAGLRPGERMLDVGCGLGRATLLLADAGFDVEGLDLSPVLLAGLREAAAGREIAVHEGDVAQPPEQLHGRFDVVCGFFVLHHLHDLAAALSGVRQVLRPGGRIVFVEPNAFCPLYAVQFAVTPGMTLAADGGMVRMRPGPLRAACAAAGFGPPRQATFGLLPPFAVNRPRGAALERALEDLPPFSSMRAFRLLVAERLD